VLELVVEGDRGGRAPVAGEDSFAWAGEGASVMALAGEQVFAGLRARLDALADRREMRALAGLVCAAWSDDRSVAESLS
jgi:hypothetical protein